jgi:hypothetical protein
MVLGASLDTEDDVGAGASLVQHGSPGCQSSGFGLAIKQVVVKLAHEELVEACVEDNARLQLLDPGAYPPAILFATGSGAGGLPGKI